MLGIGLIFSVFTALAFNQVDAYLDPRTLLVRLDPEHRFVVGDQIVVISKSTKEMAAIGVVTSVVETSLPPIAAVKVREIIGNRLVLPGDAVERLSHDALERYHLTGHISLMLGEDDAIPAKYKELPYLGVFNSDGHTLAKKRMASIDSASSVRAFRPVHGKGSYWPLPRWLR